MSTSTHDPIRNGPAMLPRSMAVEALDALTADRDRWKGLYLAATTNGDDAAYDALVAERDDAVARFDTAYDKGRERGCSERDRLRNVAAMVIGLDLPETTATPRNQARNYQRFVHQFRDLLLPAARAALDPQKDGD